MFVFGITIGVNMNYILNYLGFNSDNLKKYNSLVNYVKNRYYADINIDSLVDESTKELIQKLDPHSAHISKKELSIINETMEGVFVGIGISFKMINDSLTVLSVMKNGPSQIAGIYPGDRILIANGDTLFNKNLDNNEIISKLKGKENTVVDLDIYRNSNKKIFSKKISRGKVPIKSVIAYKLMQKTGYIKVERFGKNTHDEFINSFRKLNETEKIENLVLDLRNNPGGFLFSAEKIVDQFFSSKKTILITETKRGVRDTFFTTNKGVFRKGNLYILVNGQSASASEVVAGAVQDNKRGTIIGRRTFGKGLVQQHLPLGGGDVVKLTTSRYYTPSGKSIQRSFSDGNEEYFNQANNLNYHDSEDINKLKIKDSSNVKYNSKNENFRGGISPDIQVKIANKSDELDKSILNNMITNFVYTYLDSNRDNFFKGSKKEYLNLSIDYFDTAYQKFKKLNSDKKLFDDLSKNKTYIKNSIKAYYGFLLFGEEVLYEIFNDDDEYIKIAINSINKS